MVVLFDEKVVNDVEFSEGGFAMREMIGGVQTIVSVPRYLVGLPISKPPPLEWNFVEIEGAEMSLSSLIQMGFNLEHMLFNQTLKFMKIFIIPALLHAL